MHEPSTPPQDHGQYLRAVLIMAALGVVGSVLILLVSNDPLPHLGILMAGLAPTTAALLAMMKSQETHLSVNSRLDEWIAASAEAQRLQGQKEGQATERARQENKEDSV